ncbi:MAG: hypothetical protein NC311_13945 [Muribaculaceae bacterium]|nr:hypothetical protein [Muribaculaceae bacterium]
MIFGKKIYFTPEEEKRLKEAKRKVAAYEAAYDEARIIVRDLQKAQSERHAAKECDFEADQKAHAYYTKFAQLENKLNEARQEAKNIEAGELTDAEIDKIMENFPLP